MKSTTVRKLTRIIFTLILVGTAGDVDTAQAQRGRCGNQTFCYDGNVYPFCIPAPTTLPAVSQTFNGGYGFNVASRSCGAKRCWWLFACSCGPSLGAGICSSATAGGDSDFCGQENN